MKIKFIISNEGVNLGVHGRKFSPCLPTTICEGGMLVTQMAGENVLLRNDHYQTFALFHFLHIRPYRSRSTFPNMACLS